MLVALKYFKASNKHLFLAPLEKVPLHERLEVLGLGEDLEKTDFSNLSAVGPGCVFTPFSQQGQPSPNFAGAVDSSQTSKGEQWLHAEHLPSGFGKSQRETKGAKEEYA